MFKLSSTPLKKINLRKSFRSKSSGAFVSFEGLVRNLNEGRSVVALEYEADAKLCAKEAEKIFKETQKKFDILSLKCFHRVGKLKIGEMAVWVGVLAPHRDSAFAACRYIINELKYRLPIWKKEYYTDGQSGWINFNN